MESIAYYDGKIGAPEELMVPFNDRVHFFGDGCYDATVGANGKVYLLQDHLDRFFTSAKALDINIPMSKAELGRLLTDLLAADLNALGETLTYLSARTALTIDYTTAAVAAARGGVQLTEEGMAAVCALLL
jgi:branched-subunit amino acid aminotransferase/4-amino-4-deoxychorismate lyase